MMPSSTAPSVSTDSTVKATGSQEETSHVRNSYSSEELSDVLTTSGITEGDFHISEVSTDSTVKATGSQEETSHVRNSYSSEELSDVLTTSGITEDDFHISEEELSQNHWILENVEFEVSIIPDSSPLQGRVLCQFTFNPTLPARVQSGFAEFENLDTVEVNKFKVDCMIGDKIPPSQEPGWVTVTLKSQYGIKLGETRILYVDEEKKFLQLVVQDPRRQRRLFIEWAEWASKQSGDSETSSGETQNSGNLVSTQPVNVLQLMIYAAAETGAQQFIEMIFSTSAGRIVFDAYKGRTPLPEVVARNQGHEETACYLENVTTRFSKEKRSGQEWSQTINWSELVAAAEVAQGQPKDNQLGSDDTDYFGDVDTSSCESSEPAGSDSEGSVEDEIKMKTDALEKCVDESTVPSSLLSRELQCFHEGSVEDEMNPKTDALENCVDESTVPSSLVSEELQSFHEGSVEEKIKPRTDALEKCVHESTLPTSLVSQELQSYDEGSVEDETKPNTDALEKCVHESTLPSSLVSQEFQSFHEGSVEDEVNPRADALENCVDESTVPSSLFSQELQSFHEGSVEDEIKPKTDALEKCVDESTVPPSPVSQESQSFDEGEEVVYIMEKWDDSTQAEMEKLAQHFTEKVTAMNISMKAPVERDERAFDHDDRYKRGFFITTAVTCTVLALLMDIAPAGIFPTSIIFICSICYLQRYEMREVVSFITVVTLRVLALLMDIATPLKWLTLMLFYCICYLHCKVTSALDTQATPEFLKAGLGGAMTAVCMVTWVTVVCRGARATWGAWLATWVTVVCGGAIAIWVVWLATLVTVVCEGAIVIWATLVATLVLTRIWRMTPKVAGYESLAVAMKYSRDGAAKMEAKVTGDDSSKMATRNTGLTGVAAEML